MESTAAGLTASFISGCPPFSQCRHYPSPERRERAVVEGAVAVAGCQSSTPPARPSAPRASAGERAAPSPGGASISVLAPATHLPCECGPRSCCRSPDGRDAPGSPSSPSRACGSARRPEPHTSATRLAGRSAAWPGASRRADRLPSARVVGSRMPGLAPRRGSRAESHPTRDHGGGQGFAPVASRIPHLGRVSLQRCHRRNQTVRGSSPCGRRCRPEVGVPWPARHLRSLMHVETEAIPLFGVFPAARLRRAAVPTGGRRSLASGPSGRLWSGPVKSGGGGGNRTRVRKPSATTSTCISGLWAGTRARRRLSLFRSRVASTRRIAARNLSLVLTDGSGRPPAKPA